MEARGGHNSKNMSKMKNYPKELLSSEDEKEENERNYIEDFLVQKQTAPAVPKKVNKSLSYTKSNKQSINKMKDFDFLDSKKRSKMQSILNSR
jgi:protein subunit release factor B